MATFTPSDGPYTGLNERLFCRFVRVSIWIVVAMLVLWWVGVEGIYYHVTPLYALYMPVFGRWWLPLVTAVAIAGGFALWRRWLLPDRHVATRYASLLGVAIALALSYAAWTNTAPGESIVTVLSTQLLAAAVFGASMAGLTIWLRWCRWPEAEPDRRAMRWLLAGLVVFAFVFPACVAMLRGGVGGIAQAYMRYETEYVNDIGRGLTIRGLFHDYLKMHPYLTLHSKAHPPGPIAILWLWSYVVGRSALGLSLATLAMAAAGVVPFFYWVRDMLGKKTAVTTTLLFVLMPSVVMFSATSADAIFMAMGVTTVFLFWRGLHRNSMGYQLGAGAMYAACSLTSFTLISLGAFFGFAGLLRLRDRRVAVIQTAATMLVAFVAVHALVRWWSGFDVVGVFQACLAQFQHDQLSLDMQEPRYAAWVYRFLNPFTFFIYAGIPVSLLFLGRYVDRRGAPMGVLGAVLATAFVLNLLYMGRGEGERSALYLFPFLAIPAGSYLQALQERARSAEPLLLTAGCLGFQCWLMESLLYTYW